MLVYNLFRKRNWYWWCLFWSGGTDDGNEETYSFDPAAAGIGTHTITYTLQIALYELK
jgi:hypothetical protein